MWNCWPAVPSRSPAPHPESDYTPGWPFTSVWTMDEPTSSADSAGVAPRYDTGYLLSQVASALERQQQSHGGQINQPGSSSATMALGSTMQSMEQTAMDMEEEKEILESMSTSTRGATKWALFSHLPSDPAPKVEPQLPQPTHSNGNGSDRNGATPKKRRLPMTLSERGNSHSHSHSHLMPQNGGGFSGNYVSVSGSSGEEDHYGRRQASEGSVKSEDASSAHSSFMWCKGDAPIYSRKVFIGGLPSKRLSKEAIQDTIAKEFNPMLIQWHHSHSNGSAPGFVHIIFKHIEEVYQLLRSCSKGVNEDGLYYRFASGLMVEIIPWDVRNNRHVGTGIEEVQNLASHQQNAHVVFVAGLHGMSSALYLYTAMNQLFGNVLEATLETDKYGYPLGMGKVAFSNRWSFLMAINKNSAIVNLVDIKERRVLIEPYLSATEPCAVCGINQGPYFCRNFECLVYYCISCFRDQHKAIYYESQDKDATRIFQHRIMFKEKTRVQKEVSDAILSSIYCECTTGFSA